MNKEEIFGLIDSAIATRWDLITAQQEALLQATGNYWQGLLTHSTIPADGAAIPPDRAGEKPSGQPYSWLDLQGLPSEMASALRCDSYAGPQGKGYVLVMMVEIEGIVYERLINVGPEAYRSRGWHERPSPQIIAG